MLRVSPPEAPSCAPSTCGSCLLFRRHRTSSLGVPRLPTYLLTVAFPANRPSKDETLGLFAGLPRRYDLAGAVLSFGQDPRWRRAMVARGACPARSARPGRRHRNRHGRRRARPPLRLPRRRPRPEPGDARRRPGEARRRPEARLANRAGQGRGRVAALRGWRVRPPHLHLSAPLRRGPRGHPARAGAGGQAGWTHRLARVHAPSQRHRARSLVDLHARRDAGPRSADLPRLVRGRPLPRAEHHRALPAAAARSPAGALAGGRHRGRSGQR